MIKKKIFTDIVSGLLFGGSLGLLFTAVFSNKNDSINFVLFIPAILVYSFTIAYFSRQKIIQKAV